MQHTCQAQCPSLKRTLDLLRGEFQLERDKPHRPVKRVKDMLKQQEYRVHRGNYLEKTNNLLVVTPHIAATFIIPCWQMVLQPLTLSLTIWHQIFSPVCVHYIHLLIYMFAGLS